MPYTKDEAREKIGKLVEDFRAHEATLEKAPEAQIENNFIRPLFRYLNWNTENEGLSLAHYEFKVQVTNKKGVRPDTILNLDGRNVLVMDAKQVKYSMHDPRWLFQVYSYAYSTQNSKPSEKIDFAILTDFQELVVLDCTLYAAKPEAVNSFRVIDWKYTDYVEKFDQLWELLERNQVLNDSRERKCGLWSRYLSPQKVKANRIPPDKAFLAQMDDEKTGWRVLLAKDMKKRNPSADGELITAAVQLLIDRLIFIKALSDREIDGDYLGELGQMVEKNGLSEDNAGWFKACQGLFIELNNFYNGSIFAPRPELENVSVSNQVVRSVIRDLQPEHSPYNFAVLPVEILGTIYERFLGRVVRTTEKRVTIEDKPEVRKAGGVYYTPQYIVEYIVENTLGQLLDPTPDPSPALREKPIRRGELTPADVAKLRIIDPACGSGSFLLGAYNALIDWHKAYFARRVGRTGSPTYKDREHFYVDESGQIRLTAKLKREVLRNNLFGVDIDPQAVEVTRFSLSLKALEDLREGELTEERSLFHQTVLPDLSQNIKNGNSLIGTDYFGGQLFPDLAEMKRINAFDWEREFPQVFTPTLPSPKSDWGSSDLGEGGRRPGGGGFDCVIGNPPYLFITELEQTNKDYYFKTYQTSEYRFDVYGLFTELSIKTLLKNKGYLSFIIPHTLLSNDSFEKLRRLLLENTFIDMVTDIGPGVFETAKNETMIFVIRNEKSTQSDLTKVVITNSKQFPLPVKNFDINQEVWSQSKSAGWLIKISNNEIEVISKIENQKRHLGDLCTVNQGLRTGDNEKYLSDQKLSSLWKPAAGGKQIGRYEPLQQNLFVYYDPKILDAPRKPEIFISTEKVVVQEIRNITLQRRIIATYDPEQFYCLQSTNVINLRENQEYITIKCLLGILNCGVVNYYFRQRFTGNNHIASNQLAQIPIPIIDKTAHDKMVTLVTAMLELHKAKAGAKTESGQNLYARQIEATDRQIDALVYQLYGLTEAEIQIVTGKA